MRLGEIDDLLKLTRLRADVVVEEGDGDRRRARIADGVAGKAVLSARQWSQMVSNTLVLNVERERMAEEC